MPPLSYKDTVDKIFEKGQQYFESPHIPASLHELQVLSDELCSCVPWVVPVSLVLIERPDECDIQAVRNIIDNNFTINRIPQAMIDTEVEPMSEQWVVCGTPIIYFFDRRFLSVGTLLHELAHLRSPFSNHGERFRSAHEELISAWNLLRDREYVHRSISYK